MQTENHYTETDLGNVSPNPRGNYDNAVKYEYLDLVTMQGGSYLCVIPVGQTITGTAPEPGATTEYWQCLAMPGDRTPEYTEAHDKVVRLAKEVAQNTTKVAEDKQSVAQMETDVRQLKEQTAESARQAEKSKDSAVGSARAAKTAEDNIRQAESNVRTLINGFDTHVAEKTTEATQAVATAKDNAVQAVGRQETASVQAVKDQTATYITEQKNLAKQELDDKVNQFGLDVNVIKAEVSKEGQKQITNVQEATTAELAKITEKGTEQAGIVTTEGEKQVQAVQTAAQEIVADREQINTNKEGVAKLKEDISGLLEDSYGHIQETWCEGEQREQYTTSTFSGFATSWEITEDKYVNAIYFKVRTRDVNITEIRVRIESGDFSFEKSISVNIGTEMTEVCFPVNYLVPKGTVWIGIAANKICTYMHVSTSTLYSYYYWTNGDMDNLSNLKQTSGSVQKLYIKADIRSFSLMNENIYDKTGKKEDVFDYAEKCGKSFENKYVKEKKSTNIFDKDTMSADGSWYYFKDNIVGEGKEVTISSNEYTGDYSAISIPVIGPCEITLSSENKETYIYGYFCVDNENITNSGWATNINKYITNGHTINVPSGTKKVLISIKGYWRDKERYPLMINLGSPKLPYEPYYKYPYLDGIVSDLKVETKVEKLDEYIGIDSPDKVCLKLPDCYDLVVGDTFELFYKGIINSVYPELYDVIVDCAKGSAYTKRFVITPTLAENLTLTVTLYGINHTIVDRKSVILRVNEKVKTTGKTNILCVGDSLTTDGIWVSELHRRITGTGGNPNADNLSNVNFIGSRQINGTGYEGYGGWTFNSYNTENVNSNTRIITCTHSKNSNDQHSVYRDTTGATWKLETIEETTIRIIAVSGEGRNFPDSGTLKWVSGGINHDDIVYTSQVKAPGNPFWDTAKNKVDFEGYASKNGVADINYMYVLLGWNSASDSEEKYKNNVRIFINNVLSAFPNCKIVLMGLQLPARDGLGANYGATGIYSRYFDLMRHVWNLDKWYKDISLEFPNKVTTINIAGQFDTENNMPESIRTVNVRNSKEETYQTNGVHPATAGYHQIADAAYRDLVNKLFLTEGIYN